LAATATREYELVLMLDPEAPDERRDQIVTEARSRIEAAGTIKHDTAWGMRKMAFEIRQRTEADYRFFRFESAPPLLESLDHDLKIADGVLRFRIFSVDPRSPIVAPPAPTPGGAPARAPRQEEESAPATEPGAEAGEPAAEAAPPGAEQPAPEAAPTEPDTPAEASEPPAPEADEPSAPAEEPPAAPEAPPVEPEEPTS
jgi:small subunit ribosomal protein S6